MMSVGGSRKQKDSAIELELYFLIERFLSTGPCKSAATVLRRELDEHGLLPKRIDWEGGEHERSFESLLELNRHIGCDHLLKICQRLGPLMDEKVRPNIMGVKSLLGAGSQSLLRTQRDMKKLSWQPQAHLALQHGRAALPPVNLVPPKWQYIHRSRELTSQTSLKHVIPISMYTRIQQHSRKLGHLSAVYCALFDKTGKYIFTAADDALVKIWWVFDSRLKATLRGHAGEITDMAINYENTLLASGSCDKTVRVWCLKSCAPAAVLQGHTGMITSLQFSPMVKGNRRYLASTGGDACVCFWEWNVTDNSFNSKPVKYIEKSRAGAQVLCSSFSPGGMFFAAGSTDNVIRMYHFHTGYPEKIGELEKHTDRVDSIGYANNDNRFLSGSKDGTACIWKFERNEWRSLVLDMTLEAPKRENDSDDDEEEKKKMKSRNRNDDEDEDNKSQKLKVTMVGWNIDDTLVMTAINDHSLKVWCSFTGKLLYRLRGHNEEVFVLEPSPIDPRIMMSAGHDGNIFIWDIIKGRQVKRFFNRIEGQGHGAVFDCKFSPDGTMFTATDSHGQMMIYGYGENERCNELPDQLFFHTDYRPLIRDSNNYVLDEQTQQAPHLMPSPFLVDIDGNPYPPDIQRLVPGREHCRDDQLIPEVAVNEEGEQEVMGDRVQEPPEDHAPAADVRNELEPGPSAELGTSGEVQPNIRASIDQMIEQLAREQDQRRAARGEQPLGSPPPQMRSPRAGPSRLNSVAGTSGSHMVGMRRVGETEGVRQSLGNILQVSTSKDLVALSRRMVIKGMDPAVLKKSEDNRIAHADMEVRQYILEKRKKNLDEPSDTGIQTRKKKKRSTKHGYSTRAGADNEDAVTNRLTRRALYDTDEEVEEELGSDIWEEDDTYLDVDDSSEYSDWCVETSINLEPPKRKSTRARKRKRYTSSESSEEEEPTPRGSREQTPGSREGSQSRGKAPKKQDKQATKKVKRKRGGKQKQTAHEAAALPGKSPEEIQELLRIFRPPDWLTDVVPRKQPYFPQMGDEVMYFRQGHEFYVKEVVRRKVYHLDPNKNQAWHKYPRLREQELVRIVGIRYEMLKCGVRLCCLKLNYIDPSTLKNSGGSFSIRYHDMPDVVDFLVLKQNYDIAMSRNWKPGDRFRSVIDDSWWIGVIEAQVPHQKEYPDCMFQCFKVRWDNSEKENLSPWDMEPFSDGWLKTVELNPDSMHAKIRDFIADCKALFNHHTEKKTGISDLYKEVNVKVCCDLKVKKRIKVGLTRLTSRETCTPKTIGKPRELNGSIKITAEERKSFMYKPKSGEWPGGDIEEECDRIVHGWDQVMEHSIAEPFLTPVDINVFPSYAMSIEYPMDLNTIKRRLENRFYRRVTALQFDLRYIESNAKKFNEPRSQIVKSAQILCDALLTFIGDRNSTDACRLINKMVHGRNIQLSSDSEDSGEETEDYDTPGTSAGKKKSNEASAGSSNQTRKHRLSVMGLNPDGWKVECKQLLETIVQCEDSEPFRLPVDINSYQDYYNVIEFPMDLSIVRENLENGNYKSPQLFAKDMSLIFSNSKTYNTNKRAKRMTKFRKGAQQGIYTMTLRLSAMFESRMKEIMTTWRKAVRRQGKQIPNHTRPRYEEAASSASIAVRNRPTHRVSRTTRPGTSGITNGRSQSTTDDDTDVDVAGSPRSKGNFTRTRPIRERRTIQMTTGYNDSDLENQEFPEPKPDYSDDDFELQPRKSPRKKGTGKKTLTNGSSQEDANQRYSTRARTGTIKMRKYTNKGFFTDEDDNENVINKTSANSAKRSQNGGARSASLMHKSHGREAEIEESSDSDTEVESQRKRVKRGRKPARKRRKVRANTDSESKTENDSEEDDSSSDDSATEDLESDLEHHSPVTRLRSSQGSQSSKGRDSESDSGPPGRLSRYENSSHASQHTFSGSRQGRRTRNQGKSTIKYTEDSDNTDSDDAAPVTVSMRGRVRRPTARARAMWE
ncbi:bromodomain and WD repeat-containing protein 3-like isoform X3 [Mercenaria mercenaria]|uniref:bromodomain and WD repeat-containing protein 3-like isoform X3 n=1 Tax=Mercenaria mercenaria TaxID=6596 RepID=UPI00234F54D4|nr:bromodomain and WD repeat-containing protein 3-like isoform X3 [Mercenaria mercenaria]